MPPCGRPSARNPAESPPSKPRTESAMKTFADNAGRTWTVAINVDAIKRVRDLAQTNLLEVIEGKLLEKLIGDPVLLCDVIYSVCKPEADAKSITDVDFG